MAPGTVIEAAAVPYPALMYIETGTTARPGAPGRIVYAPDGTIVEESTEDGVQYTPAGSTQYIPAADSGPRAATEETELMSSIILEFVPVDEDATPTALFALHRPSVGRRNVLDDDEQGGTGMPAPPLLLGAQKMNQSGRMRLA